MWTRHVQLMFQIILERKIYRREVEESYFRRHCKDTRDDSITKMFLQYWSNLLVHFWRSPIFYQYNLLILTPIQSNDTSLLQCRNQLCSTDLCLPLVTNHDLIRVAVAVSWGALVDWWTQLLVLTFSVKEKRSSIRPYYFQSTSVIVIMSNIHTQLLILRLQHRDSLKHMQERV